MTQIQLENKCGKIRLPAVKYTNRPTTKWLRFDFVHQWDSISVVEGRQQDRLLISVPVEFAAFMFEFRVSGTFVLVTGVGHRDVHLSERSLVDHGYDGDAQRFTKTEWTWEPEERHDVDQFAARNVETMNGLVLRWSWAIGLTACNRSCQDVTRFRFTSISQSFITHGFLIKPVVHVDVLCPEVVTFDCTNTRSDNVISQHNVCCGNLVYLSISERKILTV